MTGLKSKSLRITLIAGLLTAAVISTPAKAHSNNHGYAAPLAAFVAFSWLAHNSHHRRHYHGHGHRHHGHYGHKKRRHSYSQGGYSNHRRRHNHYRH